MSSLSQKKQGIPANSVMLPMIGVLTALHVVIIVLIFNINTSSMHLSQLMQSAGTHTADATSLLAGSSLMSETTSNYVLMPLTEDGEPNTFPLLAYANELTVDRRGDQVLERFRSYDVSEEAFALLSAAAVSANYMMEQQVHAISLVRTVYPLPDQPPLNTIPVRELTEEERALSDGEKLSVARYLILSSEYARNKQAVSQNVNACVDSMNAASAKVVAETSRRIAALRVMLWAATLSIIVILILNFVILYRQLILPLGAFVRLIETDDALQDGKGLREVRLLAAAYNRLLKRRAGLESILRTAAETDALTGLPNRYGFEQYLLESGQSGYAIAVFLFDINYLKTTNDTLGHSAGDKLIRSAADCIYECFGSPDENNCFRFGGDEFAAVEKNSTPERVAEMVERFKAAQERRGISISWGYAFTEEIGTTTFKKLMDEADKQMYARKVEMHRGLEVRDRR